jgi:hypothetical protein
MEASLDGDIGVSVIVAVDVVMMIGTIAFTFFFIRRQNKIDYRRSQGLYNEKDDEIKKLEKRLKQLKKARDRH